jgi:predicted RNase H-like HicB family nuclease
MQNHEPYPAGGKSNRIRIISFVSSSIYDILDSDFTILKAKQMFEIISAYSPDLPECLATGATVEAVKENRHEAIEMHIQGLMEDRLPIPKLRAMADYIAVWPAHPPVASGEWSKTSPRI